MNNTQPIARPYFRTPSLAPNGQQLAFVYASAIWLADIATGAVARLTSNPAGHSAPRWSPDGSQIACASSRAGAYDLYLLPLDSAPDADARVRRLTTHAADSIPEDWSPDGQFLFFSSDRERHGGTIYRVAAGGGTPIPWISQPLEDIGHVAVSPDGRTLAFNVLRDHWWRRGPNPFGGAELWLVSNAPDATDYRKVSDYAGLNRWPMWSPDGAGLFFVSDRSGIENIWFQPLDGAARQITSFAEGRLLWPSISRDGATIVFERDFAIWRLDVASGQTEPIRIRMSYDSPTMPARVQTVRDNLSELALAPDGKKLALVVRGEVFADFADKETDKDQRGGPAFRITNNSFRDGDMSWSPDSRKLVYTSDREGDEAIYRYDFGARAEQRLTDSARPKHNLRYAPNGEWLAYACGEDEIRLINSASGEDRPLVRASFMYSAHYAWSPDSSWIAFIAQDERWFSNVYVQRVDSEAARQITFLSNRNAHTPLWSPDGRFIIFTSEDQMVRVDLCPPAPFFREAEFEKLFDLKEPKAEPKPAVAPELPELASPPDPTAPEPEPAPAEPPNAPPAKPPAPAGLTIVFEGIERRLRMLTPTQMQTIALSISPDSRDLIFRATVAGKPNLWTLPLDEPRQDQPPRQLTFTGTSKWAAQFAPDGKSFFYLDNGQVILRKFPAGDASALAIYSDVTIDFNQEKRQMFDECWRLLRDYFYDPTFRGLNWRAAYTQFAPLAAGAHTGDDLRAILNLMVGELRASHLGAFGSDSQPVPQGYLGLLFDPAEQAASGRLRVAEIIPDGPVALANSDGALGPGDELLAINGDALDPAVNIDTLLQRTAGRRVVLRFGPRDGGAPRELAVRPISGGAYGYLRYRAWVYANEAYVHRASAGRLGYVHIRAMDFPSYQRFLADLDSEAYSKEGVIVDARFNSGGSTATFILDILARRSVLLTTFRDRPPIDAGYFYGNRVLNKPTILLINEGSASNTEIFAEGYRRLGLGKVVGRPSAGAVIGRMIYTLIDGTHFLLPRIKFATPEGEDLEGTGRAVDIDVAQPIGAWARGGDRQLDAAVAELLGQIDGAG